MSDKLDIHNDFLFVMVFVSPQSNTAVSYTHLKDSGNGISKEEQERIFDRFYQANNRNKAIHVGTGIGLALTKSIIQLHHGTIEVESELNEGSCFIVKLPKTRDCFEKDTEVVFLESPEKEPMVQENTIPDENFMKKDDSTFETPLIDEREGKRKVLLVEDNVEPVSYTHLDVYKRQI